MPVWDVQLTVLQNLPVTGTVVLTTPQPAAVDVPSLGSLPLDPPVRAGGDDGDPIVRRDSDDTGDTAAAFEDGGNSVEQGRSPAPPSPTDCRQ